MELFNTRVDIESKTKGTLNAAGEADESWAAVTGGTNVKARIQPYTSSLKSLIPGLVSNVTHRIYLQANVEVDNGYKVIDSNDDEYIVESYKDWHTYQILDVKKVI